MYSKTIKNNTPKHKKTNQPKNNTPKHRKHHCKIKLTNQSKKFIEKLVLDKCKKLKQESQNIHVTYPKQHQFHPSHITVTESVCNGGAQKQELRSLESKNKVNQSIRQTKSQ